MLNHDPKKRSTAQRARLTYKQLLDSESKVMDRVFTDWEESGDIVDPEDLISSDNSDDSDSDNFKDVDD